VPAYKALFNLCDFVLRPGSVGGFVMAGGRLGDVSTPGSLLGLLMAMLTFFVANTGLVSIAVGWSRRFLLSASVREVLVTLNTQLAGARFVILVGMLRQNFGAWVFFLVLPFCIMSYHFYKAYFPRASQRDHRT